MRNDSALASRWFWPLLPCQARNRHTLYSVRTVQAMFERFARQAGIAKRVYPRHSIATILLDSGLVPIDQVQKFLCQLAALHQAELEFLKAVNYYEEAARLGA
jgi:hypothetical protein